MERRAADVIEAITNSGIKYDESEIEKIAQGAGYAVETVKERLGLES